LKLCAGTSDQAGNSAGVLTISKVDITSLTPRSSPRVTYDPITTRVRRVTDELDSMIDGVSALGSVENTSSVVLPWLSIAADGERHGTKSRIHGSFVTSDGDDLVDVDGRRASARCATSVTCGVWVAAFSVEAVGLDPAESLTRVTSVASSISTIAVDDFLRSSIRDTSSSDEVGGFGFFSGREGPARTTLTLVLDWSGLTSGNPVDGTSRCLQLFLGEMGLQRLVGNETKESSELFERPVGELCVPEGGAFAVLVGIGDLGNGGDEVLELGLTFSVRSVCSVPELVELVEGIGIGETFGSFVVGARSQDGEREAQEQ